MSFCVIALPFTVFYDTCNLLFVNFIVLNAVLLLVLILTGSEKLVVPLLFEDLLVKPPASLFIVNILCYCFSLQVLLLLDTIFHEAAGLSHYHM